MKPKPGGLKRRDLERTRKRILDAAAREFDRHGLAGARLDTIATHARVNRAMIYYIFRTKENLHLAVLESLFEAQRTQVELYLDNGNLSRDDLRSLLDAYYEIIMKRRETARLLAHDIITGAKTLRRFTKRRPDLHRTFNRVSSVMNTMRGKGLLNDSVDPDLAVMTVFLVTIFLACMLPHMDLVVPRGCDAHKVLSDPKKWKPFLFEGAMRVITPVTGGK